MSCSLQRFVFSTFSYHWLKFSALVVVTVAPILACAGLSGSAPFPSPRLGFTIPSSSPMICWKSGWESLKSLIKPCNLTKPCAEQLRSICVTAPESWYSISKRIVFAAFIVIVWTDASPSFGMLTYLMTLPSASKAVALAKLLLSWSTNTNDFTVLGWSNSYTCVPPAG